MDLDRCRSQQWMHFPPPAPARPTPKMEPGGFAEVNGYPPMPLPTTAPPLKNGWLEDYCPFKMISLLRGHSCIFGGCNGLVLLAGRRAGSSGLVVTCLFHLLRDKWNRFDCTLRITGPCYRGLWMIWMCLAGAWDLQTTSFEIPWFSGHHISISIDFNYVQYYTQLMFHPWHPVIPPRVRCFRGPNAKFRQVAMDVYRVIVGASGIRRCLDVYSWACIHSLETNVPPATTQIWLVVLFIFFIFTPTWGRWTHFDSHFQMGWNHQLANAW